MSATPEYSYETEREWNGARDLKLGDGRWRAAGIQGQEGKLVTEHLFVVLPLFNWI